MSTLLIGANGQVGWSCQQEARLRNQALLALGRESIDLRDPESVYRSLIERAPSLVINAAAYTAVDQAESDPQTAELVNASSPGAIAKACQALGIPLIHLSTDYVFNGSATSPYAEQAPVSPQSVYGASKQRGESAVLEQAERSIILRTSWVFGVHGSNFVKTMLRLAETRDELGIVSDQQGCPTFAGHIAEVIFDLVERYQATGALPWGIYHLCDRPATSWYGFAECIFNTAVAHGLLEKAPKLKPIPTSDYPTPAKRPAYSILNTRKLETLLGRPMKDWSAGLDALFTHLAKQR